MTNKIIPGILMLLMCCGCDSMFEREFIPHGLKDTEPKIFIQTVMDAGRDRIRIDAGIATPAFGNAVIPDEARVTLQMKVNGEPVVPVEDKEEEEFLIHQQCFYVDGPLKESDTVEIHAEYPGIASASCRTVLPSVLPVINIESARVLTDKTQFGYQMDQIESDCTRFRISIDEEPRKDRFYGVQVWRESEENRGYDMIYTLRESDIPMSGRKYDVCGTYDGADFQVFDCSYNAGGKISFDVFVKYIGSGNGPWRKSGLPRYKLVISRITPELYRSVEKLRLIDGLWSLGIGPHAYNFSNVEGGLGIIGGKSNYVSDWIYTEKNES